MSAERAMDALPELFSYGEARRAGVSHGQLYAMRDSGEIEVVGRGLFRRATAGPADADLLEIAVRAPEATLCLATALARHDLTDMIPARIDVAVPRGRRLPAVRAPVSWHVFAPSTFGMGREVLNVGSQVVIGIYSAERSIVDAFRLRHHEGTEAAYEALRRWVRRPGSRPGELLELAGRFRGARPPIRAALDALL